MDIKAQSLYSELQSLARQAGMDAAQAQPLISNPSSQNFGDMLKTALDNVNDLQFDSRNKQVAFDMGDTSLSLVDVMVAKEKSGIAFEATVQVRNKVLDAYKQIMNMPV
ncbi:flagellar hook-basal body complex protein FliE [Bowmanella yangjiangensis]|uniref:Flagellar hook-basal body complex protein FliE n=1 Tax=Bowmanella yangjiangensis TaxID=2811230 RepID=A0ABS3CTL0_9ALTE|nr:flagellar hook-basal body complex protein FliE [Bowmanella yangjiangensis]MBN7820462.1 flagellar hook-basal body complex protein FliE [Bowmanella yangjiangensis]